MLGQSFSPLKIGLILNDRLWLDALSAICVKEFRFDVVLAAASGREAKEALAQVRPEMIVVTLSLPDIDGFQLVEGLRQHECISKILVLSSRCDEQTVSRVEQFRLQGFLDTRSATLCCLDHALARVAQGGTYFCESFQREQASLRRNPMALSKVLTRREQTLMPMIGALSTDREIAEFLGLSINTPQKYRSRLLKKLGLSSMTDLHRYARDKGFFPYTDDRRTVGGGAGPGGRFPHQSYSYEIGRNRDKAV